MPPRRTRAPACPRNANGRFIPTSSIVTSSHPSATPLPSPLNSPIDTFTQPLSPIEPNMPGEGRTTPPVDTDGNPLEQRVVGLESSMKEILDLLRAAASNPPQLPPITPAQPAPAAPVVSNTQGAPPLVPYVPPPTSNPSIGTLSIPDFFPDVDAAIVASIGKHEFKPQQLGKLIPSITAKVTTTTYTLEDGALRATDMVPIKDLPDFLTFMRALGVYFQILYRFVGTTGNLQAVIDVAVSTQGYTNLLHEYSRYFTYPAILTYCKGNLKMADSASLAEGESKDNE
ncbi:hypothetical protein CCMSSC00406_0007749 [Pleurotus cornucopiae]|uniref:Uncharacterized protein n=1 Tax=Pleurotus cornucopiae TaxID=5321 RepID=A0ACB7J014_PLECO|nr:hypothetical protein CCMSSC00406_0007749 [Pleurotus cornucopiae]